MSPPFRRRGPLGKFGSHVGGSPQSQIHDALHVWGGCEPKISEFDIKVLGIHFRAHQVFELNVAVDHILSVHVIEGQ